MGKYMKHFFIGFSLIFSVGVLADVEFKPLDIPEEACSKLGVIGRACFEAHADNYPGVFYAAEKYRRTIEHYLTLECVPLPEQGAAFISEEESTMYLNYRKMGKTCVWSKRNGN